MLGELERSQQKSPELNVSFYHLGKETKVVAPQIDTRDWPKSEHIIWLQMNFISQSMSCSKLQSVGSTREEEISA